VQQNFTQDECAVVNYSPVHLITVFKYLSVNAEVLPSYALYYTKILLQVWY